MNPINIIKKYYNNNPIAYEYLVTHSRMVTIKAIEIASQLKYLVNLDLAFIEEAAMLHDIGIIKTNAPDIGCNGKDPYILHGFHGKKMLENEGLFNHAIVCESHIGLGITKEEVIKNKLPLEPKDYIPLSIEEQIICYADKFFSKRKNQLTRELTVDEILTKIDSYGETQKKRFEYFHSLFSF